MEELRKVLACLLGLFGLLNGYVMLTAPMIAATTPAILTVASVAGVYFLWPKKPNGASTM